MFRWLVVLTLAAAASSAGAFSLGSRHALVVDASSGEVIMEKNAQEVVPIASLTKLMTAMVVLDAELDMDETITITEDDVDMLKHSSSRVPVGAELTRQTLLELALMTSDNRAAHALARTYPGGMVPFLAGTRRKLKEIGMPNTVIIEPTGLSPHNRSTAQEVSRMALAASRYPKIKKITTVSADSIEVGGVNKQYRNTNRLVGNSRWDILLSKTGYTQEAGRCIVMNVRAAGRNAIMVLLNAKESVIRTADAVKLHSLLDGHPMTQFAETTRAARVKGRSRFEKREAAHSTKLAHIKRQPAQIPMLAHVKQKTGKTERLAVKRSPTYLASLR